MADFVKLYVSEFTRPWDRRPELRIQLLEEIRIGRIVAPFA